MPFVVADHVISDEHAHALVSLNGEAIRATFIRERAHSAHGEVIDWHDQIERVAPPVKIALVSLRTASGAPGRSTLLSYSPRQSRMMGAGKRYIHQAGVFVGIDRRAATGDLNRQPQRPALAFGVLDG